VELLSRATLFQRARAAAEHYVALPFVFRHEHQTIAGEIDLAFLETEAWVVAALSEGTLLPDQQMEYEKAKQEELAWQAVALEQLTGRPVKELVIVNVQTQHEQSFTWNETVRLQLTFPRPTPPRSGGATP
jgi:hypothetical protein